MGFYFGKFGKGERGEGSLSKTSVFLIKPSFGPIDWRIIYLYVRQSFIRVIQPKWTVVKLIKNF